MRQLRLEIQFYKTWQHVLEPLFGYLTLAQNYIKITIYTRSFNFEPIDTNNHTVSDLVTEMSKYWEKVSWKKLPNKINAKNESNLLKLNCDKAKMLLNWEAIWDFETTVKHTSSWYKNYYQNKNSLDLSKEQINLYIERIN